MLIYIIISYCTGQIFTSYKTVAAFIFGLIYALYENKIRELEKNRLLLGLIPLFLIQSYFLVKQESIISFILFIITEVREFLITKFSNFCNSSSLTLILDSSSVFIGNLATFSKNALLRFVVIIIFFPI